MIGSFIVTQVTLALITRDFPDTDALLQAVDTYTNEMLCQRDSCNLMTGEVTDLDDLAVTFMVDLIRKPQLLSATAVARTAYALARRGVELIAKHEEGYEEMENREAGLPY